MKINAELLTSEELDSMPCEKQDTEDLLVLQEYNMAINTALNQLLPNETIAIQERYLYSHPGRGASYREIGNRLSCCHESVRKWEHDGLEKLKGILSCNRELFEEFIVTRTPPRIQPKKAIKRIPYLTREEYSRMTPAQKKKRNCQLKKDWYIRNRERKLQRNKELYYENREFVYWTTKRWVAKNRDHHRQYQTTYHQAGRVVLADWFVRGQLTAGTSLTAKDIPPELLIITRKVIELERLIRLNTKQKGGSSES